MLGLRPRSPFGGLCIKRYKYQPDTKSRERKGKECQDFGKSNCDTLSRDGRCSNLFLQAAIEKKAPTPKSQLLIQRPNSLYTRRCKEKEVKSREQIFFFFFWCCLSVEKKVNLKERKGQKDRKLSMVKMQSKVNQLISVSIWGKFIERDCWGCCT